MYEETPPRQEKDFISSCLPFMNRKEVGKPDVFCSCRSSEKTISFLLTGVVLDS